MLASAGIVTSLGQLICGGAAGVTVTLNVQDAVPQLLVAVAVTAVVPKGKTEPDGMEYSMSGAGNPSPVAE